MKSLLSAMLFLSMVRMAQAQSYEGFMGHLRYPTAWIWMDLDARAGDSSVAGGYFDKSHGGKIPLAGKIAGKTLRIGEFDRKKMEIAVFTLTAHGDSLSGSWKQSDGKDSLPVLLIKTDPAYRRTAKFPKSKNLILEDGTALAQELDESCDSIEFIFARNNILGVEYHYQAWAAYPVEGMVYHTFDLTTQREINIRKEIDAGKFAAFNAYFAEIMLPKLQDCRDNRHDSEWVQAFGTQFTEAEREMEHVTKPAIDRMFSAANLPDNADYYFDGDSLRVEIWHYFGFPHVTQAMDCVFDMKMSRRDLGYFLKPKSPLRRITRP